MRTSRPHWSYSSISQFLRCPLQYYFERVLNIPRKSVSSGLILGSATHNALAAYHIKLMNGDEFKTEEIYQAFLDTWNSRESEGGIEYKANENRDDLIDLGISLVDLYLQEAPPKNIVMVEKKSLVPISNSNGDYLETPLMAFADLVTRGEDSVLKINEFKTSARSYSQLEVETSLQATCYVNAAWEIFGEWASVEFSVFVKNKTPKLQRLKTARTEEDLNRLGDLIENIERAINKKIFYPVETPLNCSWCSYRQQCREWKPDRKNHKSESEFVKLNGVHSC